jgi:hypothetical protein
MWIDIKKLVRITYIVLLMAFTVWYGHFLYPLIFGFEHKEAAAKSLVELEETGSGSLEERMFSKLMVTPDQSLVIDLGYRVIDQPYIEGRFHNIGFSIEADNANICVRCHGTVPHDKSKEIRSFLNMHAFYLGCETCHIHPQENEPPLEFRWYSKASGEVVENPLKLGEIENLYTELEKFEKNYVVYGDYGAKISPGKLREGKFEFLNRGNMLGYVQEYLVNEKEYSTARKSKAQKIIHKSINEKARECDGCHNNEQQYVPFAELGYPPRRVEELTETAVVGMVEKYKEFWIPNILTPGEKRED